MAPLVLLGLVFSIIGLIRSQKIGTGKGVAIAGIVIADVFNIMIISLMGQNQII